MIYLANSFFFNSAPQNLQVVNILKISTGKSVVDSLLSNLIEAGNLSIRRPSHIVPFSRFPFCHLLSDGVSVWQPSYMIERRPLLIPIQMRKTLSECQQCILESWSLIATEKFLLTDLLLSCDRDAQRLTSIAARCII